MTRLKFHILFFSVRLTPFSMVTSEVKKRNPVLLSALMMDTSTLIAQSSWSICEIFWLSLHAKLLWWREYTFHNFYFCYDLSVQLSIIAHPLVAAILDCLTLPFFYSFDYGILKFLRLFRPNIKQICSNGRSVGSSIIVFGLLQILPKF